MCPCRTLVQLISVAGYGWEHVDGVYNIVYFVRLAFKAYVISFIPLAALGAIMCSYNLLRPWITVILKSSSYTSILVLTHRIGALFYSYIFKVSVTSQFAGQECKLLYFGYSYFTSEFSKLLLRELLQREAMCHTGVYIHYID